MSVTDPIADMFTIIRNACMARIEKVEVPSSKLKMEILELLKKEGYIKNYKHISDTRQGLIKVYLRYKEDKSPVITSIKRVSKPGLRVYVQKDKVPRVLRGMGTAILSTSAGILTDVQARQQGSGGEVIGYVW